MQYIDAFCRGLYKGLLSLLLPSSLAMMAVLLLIAAFLFLVPQIVVDYTTGILAGWLIGSKLGDLHTYLKGRLD